MTTNYTYMFNCTIVYILNDDSILIVYTSPHRHLTEPQLLVNFICFAGVSSFRSQVHMDISETMVQ